MPRPPVTIDNASCFEGYTVKYEIYYDLVRVAYRDMTIYIPAPKFLTKTRFWIIQTAPREGERTQWFFKCPICGTASFFNRPCRDCECKFEVETVLKMGQWKAQEIIYRQRQDEFLTMLDMAVENRNLDTLADVRHIGYIYAARASVRTLNHRMENTIKKLEMFDEPGGTQSTE